jgi:hypothetical protein
MASTNIVDQLLIYLWKKFIALNESKLLKILSITNEESHNIRFSQFMRSFIVIISILKIRLIYYSDKIKKIFLSNIKLIFKNLIDKKL